MEMIEKEKGQNQSKINICESMDEEEKDRISLLPDCLLVDIISRLPSTKEAIKTGTLSKRWEHLWTNVPNLIFHHPNNDNLLHPDFFSFVDKTLTQCRHLNLDRFELITRYDIHLESQINNWIRYAVNCNVQDLSLTAWTMNRNLESEFVLHDFFFTNSCFTHLYLKGCVFNPTSSISWNKLMTLNISYANLNEYLIQNILRGSPLLENLELYGCYGFRRIDITSKSVKNFALLGYSDPEDEWHLADIIEINAPYIVSLTIADNLLLWKLLLLNVSSLVQAHLDYTKSGNYDTTHKDEEENMLKGFIQSLGHVKELKIGIFCVKVLSRLEAKGFVFPSNLKVVDVTSPLSSDSDSDSLELGDWSHGDSDENGNSEELLLDDGPESEGDKVD